ncbi:TBC1 domain family member 23-like [Mizuhopecten yessoensis]|uniref:TBC1 domain family member 23-like n=1 Tax=Mizuhopecten yessoensis TaxID=6573 RepID=UPI000B45E4B3|nr:TBC1 domain family member 23-like [Mizuhopecten yessoensis]
MAESVDDTSWVTDLETALIEECDFGTLRNICKCRPVPDHLRAEVWQICLNVQNKGDSMGTFDGLYDMEEQGLVREDCRTLVDKLGNEEEDKVSIVSDLESIATFFSKSRNEKYTSDNGWLDILQPLLSQKLGRGEVYNCFYSLTNKYIPRDCMKNGKPFHLFRLLLQYHDPELCSFLDTKKITPDTYAQSWFRCLFAATCDLQVIKYMWDVYFQHGDPFLVFFMALVILVNARDQLMSSEGETKQTLIEMLATFPGGLEAEDIEDFCSLAQYYASKTPQSFRRDYQGPLFGTSMIPVSEAFGIQVSQALCLPVSVAELLQANKSSVSGDGVRYFIVDCRPAEQYNRGHLPTAFHLDADLMLQNPMEFNTAVQALLAAQQQAISSGSVAGGEHLCFIGSGREEEDQYVHMVVANFLQKHYQYISIARGGYGAVVQVLRENVIADLGEEYTRLLEVCSMDACGSASDVENGEDFTHGLKGEAGEGSLLGKISNVVKSKGAEMKQKLTDYIKNEHQLPERHVSNTDRVGKRYRNMENVFSIGDDDDAEDPTMGSSDDERKETISLETWLKKPNMVYTCKCQEVISNGYMYPTYLFVTDSHLYVLREITSRKGMAHIQARRALGSIVKITSKKRHPELITFKYGCTEDDNSITVSDLERFLIPKAGEATKVIKTQIMKVLDALER